MGSTHRTTSKNALTYSLVTQSIKVTATPEFLEETFTDDERQHYVWLYHIHIENLGTQSVQLLNRHWIIIEGTGHIQEVKGEGVIGQQPVIAPQESFEYTSGSQLTTPTGLMMGKYEMETEDGQLLEIDIPPFSLDLPEMKYRVN